MIWIRCVKKTGQFLDSRLTLGCCQLGFLAEGDNCIVTNVFNRTIKNVLVIRQNRILSVHVCAADEYASFVSMGIGMAFVQGGGSNQQVFSTEQAKDKLMLAGGNVSHMEQLLAG
ncbi:hypothetical protein D3C76_1215160 [compost metagenome]